MTVDTTWTDPSTGGSIDLATGGTVTEAIWDKILSNLKRLGGSAGLLQTTNAGLVLVNDTANTGMTIGLTVQQGANDDEALAVKSSDVAHGMTTYAETDTYGYAKKIVAGAGGLALSGFTEGTAGLSATGWAVGEDTSKAGTSSAHVVINSYTRGGAGPGVGDIAVGANLLAVQGAGTTQMILDAEGDLWLNGTVDAYDDHDDALAVRDLAQVLPGRHDRVRRYDRDKLAGMGVLTISADGATFVSHKRQAALMAGAIGQLLDRVEALEARNGSLEARLNATGL